MGDVAADAPAGDLPIVEPSAAANAERTPEPGPAPAVEAPRPAVDPRARLIAFEAVTKTFADGTTALTPISFEVHAGEFVSIVGPSGCGKSTLLRLASGLAEPTSGSIANASPELSYVFQDASLLPWRTVQRNVELLLELEGVGRAERRRRARWAIAATRLEGTERRYPRTLSGGMRMRVSLARSLATTPDLMLFDEPFASLDEITRHQMGEEVQRLFTERSFGSLFVTHSVAEAVYLSSRVLVMSARPGRLIADITVPFAYPRPREIRYSHEFTEIAARVSAELEAGHA